VLLYRARKRKEKRIINIGIEEMMIEKDLKYYMSLKYPVTVTEGINGGETYVEVDVRDLPGCGAHGKTLKEAMSRLEEAKELWIKVSLKRGLPISELEVRKEGELEEGYVAKAELNLRTCKDFEGVDGDEIFKKRINEKEEENNEEERKIERSEKKKDIDYYMKLKYKIVVISIPI